MRRLCVYLLAPWDITVVDPPSLQIWIIPSIVLNRSRLGQHRGQRADTWCGVNGCSGLLDWPSTWTLDEPNSGVLVLVLDWGYAGSLSKISGIMGVKLRGDAGFVGGGRGEFVKELFAPVGTRRLRVWRRRRQIGGSQLMA